MKIVVDGQTLNILPDDQLQILLCLFGNKLLICNHGMLQSLGTKAVPFFKKLLSSIPNHAPGRFRALCQDSEDFPDRHISSLLMPAVVIRGKRDGGVTKFSLP